jgi:hypothetical protein
MSVCDQGRSRLLVAAVALLGLVVGLMLAAGSFAPAADAKGLSKCGGEYKYSKLQVQNISCKDAQKKVSGKVVNSWFSGKGVDWGKGCGNRKAKAAKTCHFKVSGFKCTGVNNAKKFTFDIDCAKGNQRVKAMLSRAVG